MRKARQKQNKTKQKLQASYHQRPENKPKANWFSKIKITHSIIAGLFTALVAIYNALQNFSITKETVNAEDPVSSQFRFTNTGWITAETVKIICTPNLALGGNKGKELLVLRDFKMQILLQMIYQLVRIKAWLRTVCSP